jgi:hypothetical protein
MGAATSFLNWNWASQHVQVELANGEYVSAESTLILGGPSKLSMAEGATALYPIGLLQMLQIAQNRQVARLFEVGSKRAYFIPGRLFANFQVNRILFYGPSLMRLLYAASPFGNPFKFTEEGGVKAVYEPPQSPPEYAKLFPAAPLKLYPGYGDGGQEDNRDFWVSLASEIFNIPFGFCMILKDARNRAYGAFYLEDCMVEAHSMGVDANNVVIAEGCNGQFDLLKPIQVQDMVKSIGPAPLAA